MKITVFQALTLLAKKYKDDQENQAIYQQVKHLYLSGIRNDNDLKMLENLLRDPLIVDNNYEIASGKEEINNDPVRRYFETHLCHETLKNSLDKVDYNLLKQSFDQLLSPFSFLNKWIIKNILLSKALAPILKIFDKSATSYANQMDYLYDKQSFQDIDLNVNNRKEKLIIFEKDIVAGVRSIAKFGKKIPLNLQEVEDSPYKPENRGRTDRKDLSRKDLGRDKQEVKSNNLGILRSYHPTSIVDAAHSHKPSKGSRHSDKATYVEEAQQPNEAFLTMVNPFVNSISGTILVQIRMFADAYRKGKFIYQDNEEQLQLYFKNFISYVLYSSGAHALDEYVRVFNLPEVQEEFKDVPGFSDLTLENLFQNKNEIAFEEALTKTIAYSDALLSKKALHEELVPEMDENLKAQKEESLKAQGLNGNFLLVKDDLLTNLTRSRLKKNEQNDVYRQETEQNRLDQAKKDYVENSSSEKTVKELIEICTDYRNDLVRYWQETKDKNDPDSFIQTNNTEAAIRLVDKLKNNLNKENVLPVKKIENFKKEIFFMSNLSGSEKEKVKENNKTLNEAYRGKSFLQRIKEFFGLIDKKISTCSFFKKVDEALRTPEEKEKIQQNIEGLKFTRMR